YALFPHMNVYNNIAYSLKLRKVNSDEIRRRVTEMLELVMLSGFEKRMPSELSGGQRQRVAIARAVINNPSVLLLDEPLGALDLQLRRQMQQELKKLQKQLGITFVYITHDQEEAINMSDRIVVMNNGKFEQIGTPAEIYDHPRTAFVAGFIGTANLFSGTVTETDNRFATLLLAGGGSARVACGGIKLTVGQTLSFSVRSENLNAQPAPTDGFSLPATVAENNYIGGMLRIIFRLSDGREIYSTRHGIHRRVSLGDTVYLSWEPENAALVDVEG
ncbi:MAG: ABC transporter ATP-binding protein, partial [Angelakisella sp.]